MKANFNIAKNVRNSRSIGLIVITLLLASLPVWGADIVIDLDFSNSATYPDGFPNSSTDPAVTSGTYTFGGYSFSFFAPTKVFRFSTQTPYYLALNGVNNTAENNAGYIQFPAIADYKLTEVKLTSTSGGSTQVGFSIRSSYSTTLSGGTQWTNVQNSSHTWTLTGTAANTAYRLYVVKTAGSGSKNGQVKGLKLTYQAAASCAKSVTVSDGGSSTHGSITSITTSPVATCSATAADRQVSIVVTPANGYTAPENLSVGSTSGTVTSTKVSRTDNLNGTFTFVYRYNQNDNGSISYNIAGVAKTYTISLNDQTPTTAASPSSITATYDSNTGLTGTVVTTLPTKTGYTFGGYYNGTEGSGVQLINSDGEIVASANGGGKTYTDASKNWIHSGGVTVYAKWTEKPLKNYRTSCTTSCDDQYSFHYGPHTGDWETPLCFTKTGTNDWSISNFTIPSHTNGEFYVGWEGAVNAQSVTKAWTDDYSESASVGNGAMLLLPTTGSKVGQATGAKGTLIIWDNTTSKNQYVGFKPNGYGISYGGNSYAFAETATANKWETEMVTLPNVGSTTYTMGLATGTAGTYVTCAHSSAAENINVMGMSSVEGGLRKIWLYSTAANWIGGNAKMAIWDATNSHWGNNTSDTKFMTKVNDNLWYGYVPTSATSIILVRVNPNNSEPAWDWGQSFDILPSDVNNYITMTGGYSNSKFEYTIGSTHPTTGMNGIFRMWDNSGDNNWHVHFVPYYKLTYDANGGSGAPAAVNKNSEEAGAVAISSTEPTYSGYRFMGWATTAERAAAGTVDYKYGTASDEITLTGDQTLYAVWKQLYTVTYVYGESGSGSCSNGSYIQGETVTVCATDPTKPGCDFTGWSYSPSVTVTTGTFPMPASNVTITATWTDHNYTLTHSGSNYSYAGNPSTIASGDTPLELTYTCTGSYAFPTDVSISGGGKGSWTKDTHYTWTVGEDLQSATLVITPATTITANVTITITMGTRYTVTYVHNDKGTYSGSSTTQYARPSSSITLPTVTSVSCGFYDTFEGWIASGSEYSESTSKPATVYAGGSSYTVSDNVTLRALYSKCMGDGGQAYRKVTAIGDVTDGTYILVSNNSTTPHVYSGHTGSNNYGDIISGLTADGDDYSTSLPSGTVTVTVAKGTDTHASHFTIKNGTKYFKAGSDIALQDAESWWQLTDGSNVSSKACPAGALQPVSATTYVMQEYSGNRFKTYQNTQSYYVFLYKLIDKCTKYYATNPSCIKPVGVHITYNKNAGDATMTCSNSDRTYKIQDAENQYPKLASSYSFCTSASREGYTLIGWNTQANGLGTTYDIDHSYTNLPVAGDLDGENWVTLTVYAMWAPSVSFNVGNATGGTGVPDVIEDGGSYLMPTPTAAQLGTIPCGYSFYGWSETSVTATTTKPTVYLPGETYSGSEHTLYAVYRLGEAGSNPDLFSLSYTYSDTKYYIGIPDGISSAPSEWASDKVKKFSATTDAEEALAFGKKSIAGKTIKSFYWMYDAEEVYVYWKDNAGSLTMTGEEDTDYGWTISGTTDLTFSMTYPGQSARQIVFTAPSYGDPATFNASTSAATSLHVEEASTTTYTYATNPSCETTATLAFVTNGGILNYPTAYDASSYVDLTVGTSVYLPTATFSGEWIFEGWMKGAPVTSTDVEPESENFYTVTLNTTTYSAAPAGTTTFYAVYSKTVNDKQFDPVNGGTYKLFAIMSDGTTKKYMPVWDGTQTTLTPVTSCASTGDYTITPGTGVHAGQYQITHGSYTLGVRDDANTQFKNVADTWWNIEASTSGKGTYRITVVGSSNRCLSHGGTGFFGNYMRNDVNNPSQPGYRDMEIGECIYTEYTSTPENIPYITITGSPIKITSTNGERVYAPTTLHVEAHNFTGTRRINFSATNGFATNPAYVNCLANGSYSGNIQVYYEPTTDGDGSIVTSVLTASQAAESVTQTFSAISGRNMPANFVIAVKSGSQWYALPDDCHSSGTPKAVPIEVNAPNAPTAASLVPHNVEWRLSDVVNSNSRPKDKVYFYEPNSTNDYTLYAGSAPNIQTNAQLSNVTGDNSYTYEWGLTTSDLCAYTISNANVNKNISINTAGNIGTHATNVVSDVLYLLPITAYYEPAEFQVVEWKANSVVVMYLGSATKASVQVGGNDEGGNQTLSDVKVDHGVFELAASGLTSAAFESLQIVFKNNGGTEIGRNYVAIPAIINGEVLTSAYESQKDLAESNDVVILKNSKLTTTGTGTDGTSYKFTNITVYGGGKLDIASGTKLGVTGSLILRAGGVVAGAYDYVYPQMNLGGTLTNSSGKFYYEYVTDYTHWYHYVLPFDALTSTIKYPTEYYGSAVAANNTGSWVIKRYDGATRATGNYDAWVDIEADGEPTPTTVSAAHGYIFWGAPKKVTANGVKDRQAWGIQRIAMSKAAETAKTEEAGDKTVTGLGSYSGVSGNSGKNNDQGWNLIGNPYMVNLTGLNSTSIQVGQLVHTDTHPWDGKWEWDNTDPDAGGLRYVTIPDNHFENYEAKTMAWFTALNPMKTGRTFFVQIAGANTSVAFAAANRASLMPALYAATESVDVETGIVMSDETHHDEVNFWIKDGKTAAYESNADYPKTPNNSNFNIYGVHEACDLSWIAISPEIAEGSMAIGYQVPTAGEYTLSLSETYISDKIDAIYVTDHAMSPEVTVDLMDDPYVFTVMQAETNDTRFTVSIRLKEESSGTATDTEQIDTKSQQPQKFIYHEKMYILRGGVIYDATGKKVREINK